MRFSVLAIQSVQDGNEKNVGNPLAKSFSSKIADGTLRAHESTAAKWLLEWSKMLSYWENNEKRIKYEHSSLFSILPFHGLS